MATADSIRRNPSERMGQANKENSQGRLRENDHMDSKPPGTTPGNPPCFEPEDYYFEGPLMVFTAAYHLKRGYCCGSGCRHCPYKEGSAAQQNVPNAP